MADNVLGTVQIVITGDTSQLQAAFARAEGMAAASGQVVARGFAQGADGADKIVVAIGRLAGVIQAENAAMSLAFQRNIATLAGFGNATNAATVAVVRQGVAMEGTINQARLLGSELRVLEGQQGILAAERFLTTIPGLQELSTAFFPLFGALALGEIAFRGISAAMKDTSEAGKELAEVLQKDTEEWEKLSGKLESTDIERVTAALGKVKGLQLKQFYDSATAERDRTEIRNTFKEIQSAQQRLADTKGLYSDNPLIATLQAFNPLITGMRLANGSMSDQAKHIAELQDKYGTLTEALRVFDNEQRKTAEDIKRTQGEDAGGLAAIFAKGNEKTGTDAAEAALATAKRQIAAAHDVRQARIDSEEDAGTREIESAAERTRVVQETASAEVTAVHAVTAARIEGINAVAAAEAQGKASPEQKKIEATQGIEVSAARREGLEKEKAAVADAYAVENKEGEAYANAQRGWAEQVARVWSEQFDTIAKKRREAFETANAPAAYNQLAVQGAQGVIDKGAGQQKELQIEGQKIALEAAYGQQIVKTGADRVAYLQQIAALEQAANTAKLTGLAADLRDAEFNATLVKGTREYEAALKKVAELKVQIADVGQQGINQQIQAQANVTGAKNANDPLYQVGTDINNAFQKLPGELGSALANALFDHRKGDSTGKQVGEAFKNAGKQLVGNLLTTALKDLGEKIVAETGIQTLFNGVFQTGTAAQTVAATANTAAVVANTAAQTASAGAGAAGGIAGAAGSAGSAAASGGLSAIAPIIGGVISGVISAVATFIGDNRIVKAVDATTAAVNGLRNNGFSSSANGITVQNSNGTTTNPNQSGSSNGTSVSIFPWENAVDVNVVSISPIAIGAGFLHLFGFDKGGPVPHDMVAQVHGGEWVLTKDQVAGRAPLPTELTGKGLSSAGLPSRLSLPSAQPSGSTPAGSGGHTFNGPMNFYGVQNVRQMMRQIADVAKSASPGFSPYSR